MSSIESPITRFPALLFKRRAATRDVGVFGICGLNDRRGLDNDHRGLKPTATIMGSLRDRKQAGPEIHEKFAGLNAEEVELAAMIQKNLEGVRV